MPALSGSYYAFMPSPTLLSATTEFDIDKGNTLSTFWPQRFEWSKFEESNIADLCLPDGGHLHSEDWTYLFLHWKASAQAAPGSGGVGGKRPVKKVDPPRSLTASGTGAAASGGPAGVSLNTAAVAELGARTRADSLSPGSLSPRPVASPRKALPLDQIPETENSEAPGNGGTTPGGTAVPANGPANDLVYGLAMFLNKSDKNARRGAIQKSLLLISRAPIFEVYQPILRHALQHILESGDKTALKTVFETLTTAWGNKDVNIFGRSFPYAAPTVAMKPDEFGSASLKELVQRFGVDTMYLWYTMLLRQRILFSGQPAHLVGECCLACPLLVAPLHGFARTITPYVALTDISPLERQHYICGITNSIMETHTHRYDMMASFSTGIVRKSNAKLSAMDKEFILNVISGMSAKGEKWVRDQFFNYTKNFLDSVSANTYKSAQHKALGEPFRLSELYETYVSNLKHASTQAPQPGAVPTESLDSIVSTLLQASAGKLTLSDAKTKQLLWDLLQRLVDLNTIDELCERNILAVIAPMLDSNSAQVRKYAVATLAQIAISIKGQISLIQHNLIPRVVLMLRDPMPNVASAAAYCLYKISSLFIGVTALVQHRVPKMLLNIICSSEDNLTLKISTAETLLQIHRLDPTLPIVGHDNIRMMIRSTSDATFRNVLLLLLDLWGEARLPIKTTEEIEFHLASLRAGGLDVRTGSTSMLLSSVAQDRNLLLQIVAAGGIQTIIKNLTQTPREEPLARLSMAILCLAADTSMGRSSLVGYSAIPTVLAEFSATDFALHLYYAYRFCEVACQYPDTTEVFLESHGLEQLVAAILKYAEKPSLQTLTMPCLGALKYLALLNPVLLHRHPELVQAFSPVAELFVRMIRRAYEQILATSPHIIAPSLRRGSISSASGSSAVTAPPVPASAAYDVVVGVASRNPLEKEFYQLLHTVVGMWKPETMSLDLNGSGKTGESASPAKSSKNSSGEQSDPDEVPVPIIDDELRSASEKLVNLLQNSSRPNTRGRRGTNGGASQMASSLTLDSINEADSEESLSRRASHVFDRGDDDDLIAAADSILADLELSTAAPGLSTRSSSRTLLTPPTSAKDSHRTASGTPSSSLAGAIEAMDDGIDQLLADLAAENIRGARSRSATESSIEILESAQQAVKEVDMSGSSPSSTGPVSGGHGSSSGGNNGTSGGMSNSPSLSSIDTAAAAAAAAAGYGSSLGGPLPGSSSARRPRWVPELNVGDMWDDIADLTTSILAEVPSAPSTPSTQGSAATGEIDRIIAAPHPTAPIRRSSDSFANPPDAIPSLNSARSQRRSSLNLTSSGSFDMDKDRPGSARSGGTSSPSLGRGLKAPNSPRGGAHSPTSAGSPRSASSPLESNILLGSGSPRKKSSSPRLLEDGAISPKREKDRERSTSHSRKTSGGTSLRSHSPTRTKGDSGSIEDLNHSTSSEMSHNMESPGRKKSRRSIQIIAPHNSLLDDTAGPPVLSASQPAIDAPSTSISSGHIPKDVGSPRKKHRKSSEFAEHLSTSETSSSSKKDRKSKRMSSELEGLTVAVPTTTVGAGPSSPSGSNPVSPIDSPDLKKLKRRSSTKNAKDKEIKKEPKEHKEHKEPKEHKDKLADSDVSKEHKEKKAPKAK